MSELDQLDQNWDELEEAVETDYAAELQLEGDEMDIEGIDLNAEPFQVMEFIRGLLANPLFAGLAFTVLLASGCNTGHVRTGVKKTGVVQKLPPKKSPADAPKQTIIKQEVILPCKANSPFAKGLSKEQVREQRIDRVKCIFREITKPTPKNATVVQKEGIYQKRRVLMEEVVKGGNTMLYAMMALHGEQSGFPKEFVHDELEKMKGEFIQYVKSTLASFAPYPNTYQEAKKKGTYSKRYMMGKYVNEVVDHTDREMSLKMQYGGMKYIQQNMLFAMLAHFMRNKFANGYDHIAATHPHELFMRLKLDKDGDVDGVIKYQSNQKRRSRCAPIIFLSLDLLNAAGAYLKANKSALNGGINVSSSLSSLAMSDISPGGAFTSLPIDHVGLINKADVFYEGTRISNGTRARQLMARKTLVKEGKLGRNQTAIPAKLGMGAILHLDIGTMRLMNKTAPTKGDILKTLQDYKIAESFMGVGNGSKFAAQQPPTLMNNMGLLYQKLGKSDKARKYYQKALKVNPNAYFSPMSGLANVELSVGHNDQAIELSKSLLKRIKSDFKSKKGIYRNSEIRQGMKQSYVQALITMAQAYKGKADGETNKRLVRRYMRSARRSLRRADSYIVINQTRDPNHAFVNYLYGKYSVKSGAKCGSGLRAFKQAYGLSHKESEQRRAVFRDAYAGRLRSCGQAAKATAIEKQSLSAPAVILKADRLMQQKKYLQARALLLSVYDGTNFNLNYDLGICYENMSGKERKLMLKGGGLTTPQMKLAYDMYKQAYIIAAKVKDQQKMAKAKAAMGHALNNWMLERTNGAVNDYNQMVDVYNKAPNRKDQRVCNRIRALVKSCLQHTKQDQMLRGRRSTRVLEKGKRQELKRARKYYRKCKKMDKDNDKYFCVKKGRK